VKIFISHAQRDRAYATELAKALKEAGQNVWEPQDLQPGDNWGLKSGEALAGADAVVVLLSPDSVASEWVRKEIEFTLTSPRLKGRLFPVLLRPTRDIPWILRELPQWLDDVDPIAAAKTIVDTLVPLRNATKEKLKSSPTGKKPLLRAKSVLKFRGSRAAKHAVPAAKK
jgi:hypothetical protein